MHRALEAADVAVSRAGASSLAELAAVRIPSILVPLPAAADDHQRRNAEEFARAGAALLAEQSTTGAAAFVASVRSLLGDADVRERMVRALAGLDRPDAAAGIATAILETLRQPFSKLARRRAAGPRFLPARETQ
jgi:UDP-N-acetylglucosamine--N-acetylmuramyl-(pentapeptide) pyrophosphoryl-undecaprenol N-acetylglucosamine transferase